VGNNPWNATDPSGMQQAPRRGTTGSRTADPFRTEVHSWNQRGRRELGESFVPYAMVGRPGGRARREDAQAARDNFGRQQADWASANGISLGTREPGARYQRPSSDGITYPSRGGFFDGVRFPVELTRGS